MAENYSVIFRGDIVMGKNLVEVKQRLIQLFKVDDAHIERIFTGKPVSLKANITLPQAKKYQAVLTQVGIVTEIIDAATASKKALKKTPAKASASTKKLTDKPPEATVAEVDFTLAPVGSDLLENKTQEVVEPVVVDHISLAEQQGNIIKDDERMPPLPATVDAESLDWDLTEVGDDLLKSSERIEIQAEVPYTENISLSDVGSDLLKDDEKKVVKDADVDTSHIKLSPNNL